MILVTGATGNIGRPLVDALYSEGAAVRAVTRNPRAAGLPAHAEVVEGDPSKPGSIESSLHGVGAVFLNPAAVGQGAGELVALAQQHGVKRIVLLSALSVDDSAADQQDPISSHHKALEDVVAACGLEWVILRPGMFAANTVAQWAGQIQAGDVVRGPYAAATAAPIHERDVAGVAARALVGDELLGRRPLLTGPDSLTQEEMVRTIGGAIGRHLSYQEIPPEAARRGLVEHGFPEPFADAMLALQAKSVGQPAITTDEVPKILGRPASAYAQWAADHAEAFVRSAER